MVIRDDGVRKVYDVTAFLDDHPGGPEIMVDVAGQDTTDEFEDIGHSNDARAQLKQYEIGKVKGDVKQENPVAAASSRKKTQFYLMKLGTWELILAYHELAWI
jgi:cytochrome b involved in lipid metabolism